jgi:DNA-binding NarL/FixJ family response regulator
MSMLRTLLLVEDEKDAADVFTRFYHAAWESSQGQLDFLTTHSLAGMRETLASKQIDILLLDLTLGDSTSSNTIALIENEHGSLPPIIVVTGDENIETRRKCIKAGARGFALKKHIFNSPNFFFAEIYNIFLFSDYASSEP